jgi:hypothetical protein
VISGDATWHRRKLVIFLRRKMVLATTQTGDRVFFAIFGNYMPKRNSNSVFFILNQNNMT